MQGTPTNIGKNGMVRDKDESKLNPNLIPIKFLTFGLTSDLFIDVDNEWLVHNILQLRLESSYKSIVDAVECVFDYYVHDEINIAQVYIDFIRVLTDGGNHYGDNNWMKANGIEEYKRFIDGLKRHALKLMAGWDDELHHGAILFNLMGIWYMREELGFDPMEA
jgi:hypothetical protein